MDLTTHAGREILAQIDQNPSVPRHWRQLLMLAFTQKDTDSFSTLQVVSEAMDQLVSIRRDQARAEFQKALKDLQKSGGQLNISLPNPSVEFVHLTEMQKNVLTKLARNPNNALSLKRLGEFFLNDWNLPQAAQKLFERARCFDPEDEDLLQVLSKAVQTLSRSIGGPINVVTDTIPVSQIYSSSDQPKGMTLHENLETLARIAEGIETGAVEKKSSGTKIPPDLSAPELLNLSLRYVQQGQIDDAMAACQAATAKEPKLELARYSWATIGLGFFERRRWSDAIDCYKKALEHDPEALDLWFNMALCHFQQANWSESLNCYLKAAQIDPENAKVQCNLGSVYFELNRLKEAEECCRKAIDLNREYARAWANLSAVQDAMGKPDEAIQSVKKSLDLNPSYGDGWHKYGYYLFQGKKYTESIQAFAKAVEFQPKNFLSHCYGAMAMARGGELVRARQACEKLEEIREGHTFGWMAWSELGHVQHAGGNLSDARESYLKASQWQPSTPEPWFHLGCVERKLGNLAEAEKALFCCVQLQPTFFNAWVELGFSRLEQKLFAPALTAFQEAVRLHPEMARGWYGIGLSHLGENREDEAMEAFLKAIDLKFDDAAAWAQIGAIYLKRGDAKQALAALQQATKGSEASAQTWSRLAEAHELLGNPGEAATGLERALGLNPGDPAIWQRLGTIYSQLGKHEQSANAFRKAIELMQAPRN